MDQEIPVSNTPSLMIPSDWKLIYKLGAIAALIIFPLGILDLIFTFLPGGATPEPGKGSVKQWFELFNKDIFLGLRALGIFNVINSILGILVFMALYGAHRRLSKPLAMLAMLLFLVGASVYVSHNPAFAMLTLSNKYAAATTDYQRSLLSAAGEALLAGSEDFTPGSFFGLVLLNMGGLLISIVMILNRRFHTITGWMGFGGYISMLIFVLWASFVPFFFSVALLFGIIGGLFILSWHVMVAQGLLKL